MISEPSRRISSCTSPTALCSLSSERNEFEQTSSASAALLWAAVVRNGRISWSTTGTPRAAICQAASDPASPPPTTCTARRRSSVMGRDHLVPFLVLQIGRAKRGTNWGQTASENLKAQKRKRPPGAGVFIEGLGISAVSAVPRDPRDVRSGDTNIGQFAVAELVELFQARVVAPPSAEEVDDCDQHARYLSPGPTPGNLKSPSQIRFHDALHQIPCCAAAMRNAHALSHWFFTKIKRFAAPMEGENVADFGPKCAVLTGLMGRPRWRRRNVPSSAG